MNQHTTIFTNSKEYIHQPEMDHRGETSFEHSSTWKKRPRPSQDYDVTRLLTRLIELMTLALFCSNQGMFSEEVERLRYFHTTVNK